MDKRIVLVLLFLASITSLVGLNWGLLHAAPAQVALPQTPSAGPDPAINPDIVLIPAQPVPANRFLTLQVVVTNIGDTDMATVGRVDHFLAPTNTFTGAVTFNSVTLPPLAAGASITLTNLARGPVVPGEYFIYSQITFAGDVDLSNNLAGPLALTVAAVEETTGVITTRLEDGRLSALNLSVFGPASCTSMGDPFSPSGSPWAPGLYTYQFEIRIPADYPFDVVRVELFDADSINQAGSSFVVQRSQLAVSYGLPLFATLSCPTINNYHMQYQPCLIPTGERNLVTNPPYLSPDAINPFWFVRIDENRRPATGVNIGCGAPPGNVYTPAYNTQTTYELFYLAQDPNGAAARVPLATYTGQVGDGVRDNGSHLTDMQWVSPGAPLSVGQPASVPTNCGSANGGDYDPTTCPDGTPVGPGRGFEVDLTQIPNLVVDPTTGQRLLQLDVTTISGASKNGFDIWAGPPVYVNDVPSDVNLRNLIILDALNSEAQVHSPRGVTVRALNYLPLNSNVFFRNDFALVEIGPEYAGQVIEISSFDSDSGAAPPLHFYFDSIYFNPATGSGDWGVTFAGTEGGRCRVGQCNNQWITPPYTLTVPGDLANCDYANPDAACIPFHGGRLLANYVGGSTDTHAWQVRLPEPPPWDPTQSCAAMPTAVSLFSHSVISSTYPAADQFTYPLNPPTYSDFPNHRPDVPLPDAQAGDVYLFPLGFDAGNFGWLVWNQGISVSANTLANSLTWPGDTLNYINYGDGGQPATPLYPHVVRGYVNPLDNSDLVLQIGDWVPAYAGVVNTHFVRAALNSHVERDRQLRLLIWDEAVNGANGRFRTYRFAIFKIVGYRMGVPGDWLLLEFMQWDDSCGQPVYPTAVTLTGPEQGFSGQSYTFTAVVTPTHTTLPITYTWQADDQIPIIHTGGLMDAVTWAWPAAGSKTITVTAENSLGAVTATHAITIFPGDLTLTTAVAGGGAVQVIPDQPDYVYGTVVTVTAVADPGWLFVGWSGDLSGSANPETLLIDDHKSITATFQVDPDSLLTAVQLTGPLTGMVGSSFSFTATVLPVTALTPITYTWQVGGQDPITRTGGLADTVSFAWPDPGLYTVTLTAENGFSTITATTVITVEPWRLYLPLVRNP